MPRRSRASLPISLRSRTVPHRLRPPAQQQQVATSLASDRADAKYSADSLRGGTEPVAAPPPPASAPEPEVKATEAAPPPAPAPSAADTAAPAPQANADINAANGDINTSPDAGTTAQAAPPPPPPAATQLPPAQPSPQVAATQMSSPPPPSQSGMPTMAQINPSDAALGFKPSSAPPLDPSIGQFVPQPIIARYDQTASGRGPVATAHRREHRAGRRARRRSAKAMGGPEMSGSVVANLDAINAAPQSTTQASVYSNAQGLPPDSVVFFPGDGTLLSAEGRAHRARRGGSVQAARRQRLHPHRRPFVEPHLEHAGREASRSDLQQEQDRANAVAKEVIAEGVPANRVLVEAVGDSQPRLLRVDAQGRRRQPAGGDFLQG